MTADQTGRTPLADSLGESVLDAPILASLAGHHARFAESRGRILRYPVDVSPFVALPAAPTGEDWADAAALFGPGGIIPLAGVSAGVDAPVGWERLPIGQGVQMIDAGFAAASDDEAVRLQEADVPDMLDLVARTEPGPFRTRTIELGRYLGVRREGRLVAMAGERLHPPGWTEISAVCTDPAFRGQGLATRLMAAVAHGIRERDETPFLHVFVRNVNAIRLYESMGFRQRRIVNFDAVRVPDHG